MANYRGLNIVVSLFRINVSNQRLESTFRIIRRKRGPQVQQTINLPDCIAKPRLPTNAKRPVEAYFLGNNVTRAVTAKFFTIPPKMTGPSGVSTRPRPSARGSNVFPLSVSHL